MTKDTEQPLSPGHRELIRILARRAALDWVEQNYPSQHTAPAHDSKEGERDE